MACVAPTTVVLTHKTGPRALVLTWAYTGNSHIGFVLELSKKDATTNEYVRRVVRTTFKNARKYTFRKLHLAVGQEWQCRITTQCKDCTLSAFADSNEVTILNGAPG